jgi:transcriptional regulator with XRE-family HTH domain
MSAWSKYVKRIKDGSTQAEAAAAAGIDQATMSRWLHGGKPGEALRVAEFARAHPESTTVLEAFVAAGFLTEAEAREGLGDGDVGTGAA